jgi:malate/lactate dehydrogenase
VPEVPSQARLAMRAEDQSGMAVHSSRRTISAVRADTMPIPIGSYHPALGVTLSLPSIVGSGGVVSVLSPDLSTEEQRELEESASTLRRATKSISC